jgi:hypothetical protein
MLGGIIVAMIFRHFVHLGNGHTQIEESFSGIDSEEQLSMWQFCKDEWGTMNNV